MRSKCSLWCAIYWLSLVSAQELAAFDKNNPVDFIKENVLAEIQPQAKQLTTAAITDFSSFPESIGITRNSNATTTRLQKASALGRTTYAPNEDNARFGRVIGSDDKTVAGSSVTDTEISTMTREEIHQTADMTTPNLRDVQNDLIVEMPPSISRPPSQERIIVNEQHRRNFHVRCEASGHPEPAFSWFKDGQDKPLNDSGEFIQAFTNGTLFFKEFSAREDGYYQCFATNKHGTSVSAKVPIVIEKPPGTLANDYNMSKNYEAMEGDPVSLECANTPPTVPEYTKRWYLHVNTVQLQITDRIGTDTQGVLRFAYVEPGDAVTYICALAPELAAARDSIRLYNTAVLSVQKRSKYTSSPKLAYSSTKVKAIFGSKATLECFFSGYPVSNITWKNSSNHEITASNTRFTISPTDFGRRLIINSVQEEDAGTFTCTANNGYGTSYGTIVVNVTAPPLNVPRGGLDTQTVPEGKDVKFTCKAKAIGQQLLDTPVWYRNGELFNENSPLFQTRYSFEASRTELHIRNVTKEQDIACFQCNISNSEGYLFYDGYLRVINSLKIEKRPNKYNVISRNDAIDMSVLASGDSCCKTDKRWYLNGVALTIEELQHPPFVWKNNGDVLLFNASTVDNETLSSRSGLYKCRVSNEYQDVDVEFEIVISWNDTTRNSTQSLPITKDDDVSEGGLELWWIGLICGILLILIAIIIIIVFVRRNYPGETYPLEKAEIKHHLDPEKDLLDQSFQEI